MNDTAWNSEWDTEMDPDQLRELKKGELDGLDVSLYANKDFLAIQMQEIRLGLESDIDVSVYATTDYDWFQMKEIRKGLERGVDVSEYSLPSISYDRMRQLRKGLEKGINLVKFAKLDASVLRQLRKANESKVNIVNYVKQGYRAEQLEEIRIAMEKGLKIDPYLNIGYRGVSIRQIRLGLEHGIDVDRYAKIEYSWQQMREIRLGLEGRLDTSLYENQNYLASQMQEIRLGLEEGLDVSEYCSLMYTTTDMKRIRTQLLEELAGAILGKAHEAATVHIQDFLVEVTSDDMEVYMEVHAYQDKEYKREDLESALAKEGICEGILTDELERIVRDKVYFSKVLVAKGTAPKKGEDGWYEYFFDGEKLGKPKLLDDGSVDYQSVQWFEIVEEGEKIAYYHEATEGIPGKTVRGKELKTVNGKEQKVLTGSGFLLLFDKKTYVAAYSGRLELQKENCQLNISKVCVVDEVTLATGNINFDGCVYVKGDVGTGTEVKATEDILIDGSVEAAVIRSGGSVLLRQGMNGIGKGIIEAEGNVEGKFFEGVTMEVEKDVRANYCMNCYIKANGKITISGKKGVLVGGVVQAISGLETYELGNRASLTTILRIGINEQILRERKEIEAKLETVMNELAILGNAQLRFQRMYPAEVRNTNEMFIKIENAIYTKEMEEAKLYKRKARIEENIEKMAGAKVYVQGNLFEGCIIEIDRLRWLSTPARNVTIRRTDNRIMLYNN